MLNLFRRTEPRPEEVRAASLRNDRAYDDLRQALYGLLDEPNGKTAKAEEVRQ